jgi:hypothetical protein
MFSRTFIPAFAGVAILVPGVVVATEELAFFENQVRPILVKHCYECHSEESNKKKGGLWLDRRSGWETGGDGGAAIVPGEPDKSLVIHSIRYEDPDLQMPPKTRLDAAEIGVLENWVAMGAPDPREAAMTSGVRKEPINYEAARREWAFRPVEKPALPDGAGTPVDRFLRKGQKTVDLSPAEAAAPAALLRRLHYDLGGLPPTAAVLDDFRSDPTAEAYAAVVEDLLARPAFGEKWGRHWLDVARYADSNGGDRNYTFYQAWRYRNYVIDALHRDKSYYDFVREQIAGDLLPAEDHALRREQLIASTFLALGPKMLTERDKEKLWLDTVDEQIDTIGRAFLGLTVGCARCHDHKFDPISQQDYYAVAGIFRSTEIVTGTRNGCVNVASWIEQPLPTENGVDPELKKQVERLELAMRLTVEKSFMKKAGGKMALGDLQLAGVIYDESDAELVGDWKSSSLSPNRFGDNYIHDDQKGKGERFARFRGSLPESGLYEVRVAYSSQANRSERVPITVKGKKGTESVTLDQTKKPSVANLFEPVGQFLFEKGGDCSVTIGTGGTEGKYVIVDAVQLIAVTDIERERNQLSEGKGEDPLFRMSEGELKKELDRLIAALKGKELAMAPRDSAAPADVNLRVRGEVTQPGPIVPRGFPGILGTEGLPEIPEGHSGRLEFAEWLTREENGLLDRVIVNRIWGYLFGRGLVETVDNFGRLGSGVTHPELLDYLAANFREKGGSFKSLIRELVLSESYQLSSNASAGALEADPENRFFARQNRRRLTAEELRDSILFLSGSLDRTPGGATASAIGIDLDAPISFDKEKLRTVYLPVARNNPSTELSLFDGANPDFVSGRRNETTVPTQALYLLNSDFLQTQAQEIARIASEQDGPAGSEVDWLYHTLLGRTPAPLERERALGLIADLSGGEESGAALTEAIGHLAHLLLASTEFLYLE